METEWGRGEGIQGGTWCPGVEWESECVCETDVVYRSSALVKAAAGLAQHPSPPLPIPILCSLLTDSLTHCISCADWGIPASTDWGRITVRLLSVCVHAVHSFPSLPPLSGAFFFPDTGAVSTSSGAAHLRVIVRQNMGRRGAGDGQVIWVTGGLSWLMCAWTWRDGLHHQRRRHRWAANCPGEEL